MNLGFYFSLLSIAVSLTCMVYLMYLPALTNSNERVALHNFIWFYALSALATAVYFVAIMQTSPVTQFLSITANSTLILLACFAILFAVRSLTGKPAEVLKNPFPAIYSLLISAVLASLFFFENQFVGFARAATYTNIIGILAIALIMFIKRMPSRNRGQRIFLLSLVIMVVAYSSTIIIDLVLQDQAAYFVTFTVAQNIGFVAMLGGIYSFYILQLVAAREHDALTDPLTGLYNRRFLTKRSEWLHAQALEENTRFSLIIVDIDHFKQINDTYGHQKGDEVITRFADVIKRTVRDSDIVIRSGGDEFVVLLPERSLEASAECARRLVAAIQAEPIPHGSGSFTVSATCGVAGVRANFDQLFQAADNALYKAKSSGRNRVYISEVLSERCG